MPSLRTVLIEDETMFRQLIVSTLGRVPALEIVGAFGLGRPGLQCCLQKKPDLLVVDLVLPDIDGLEIARQVRRELPQIKILVLTAHPSERLPADLLELGVSGYVDKTEPIDYVLSAVDTVRRGGMFFASHVQAKSGRPLRSLPPPVVLKVPLTKRETEIARMASGGLMSKEIALKLNVSLRTVEKHRENLMQKIGVHELASLTRWCIQAGIVDP